MSASQFPIPIKSQTYKMITDHGANLILTDWIDDHAEMLSAWETEARYDMDFLVEKRKLDAAMTQVHHSSPSMEYRMLSARNYRILQRKKSCWHVCLCLRSSAVILN